MTAKTNSLLIALFATCVVPALRADNGCTARTTNGAYGSSGSGFDAVHKSAAATARKYDWSVIAQDFVRVLEKTIAATSEINRPPLSDSVLR